MSSNLPPGVTGNEYHIGGPTHEWTEVATCPHPDCEWTGVMAHEAHPEFGFRAWCANPDPIDQDADDRGKPIPVMCPNRDDGFIIAPPEPEEREEEPW